MNIWILNHYAITPDMPGGTRHYDFANELVKRGYNITIFASSFHYSLFKEVKSYKNSKYIIENIRDNFNFVWVKTFSYKKNNWKRALNMLSYAWRVYKLSPVLVKNGKINKPDVVIGSTVHPFAALAALRLSQKYKVPFIFEIRDLWPQTMIDMGVWSENDLRSKFFKFLENKLVKNAKAIIALSPLTKDYLWRKYSYKKVFYIPNGVNLSVFDNKTSAAYSLPVNNRTLQYLFKLRNRKFIVMFTGAIVLSNNIDILIKAAKIIQDDIKNRDIQIVLVGEGQEKGKYESLIKKLKLNNITILDPVMKKFVPVLLKFADLLVHIQGKVFWGSTNKLFDYLASNKPIVISISVEHNNPVEKLDCGISVPPGNPKAIAEAIVKLYNMPKEERQAMGKRGRGYVEKYHSIPVLVDKLERVLKNFQNKSEKLP